MCEKVVSKRADASMSSMLRTTLLEYYRVLADGEASGEVSTLETAMARIAVMRKTTT